MAISSRFIDFALKFNHLISLRARVQKRYFFTSFEHVYNNRSTANTHLLKPGESQLNGPVTKLRYGMSHSKPPKDLSTDAITKIIAKNESYADIGEKNISFIETNQLCATDPIEDIHAEGRLINKDGFLFGVFDGHGGEACSHYVSECLFAYMAKYLDKKDDIIGRIYEVIVENRKLFYEDTIKWISSPPNKVVHEANDFWTDRLREITKESVKIDNLLLTEHDDTMERIRAAFVRLDHDLTNGPLIKTLDFRVRSYLMETASSGSCATVAYVNDRELYVANTGDSRAVIGAIGSCGVIRAEEITRDHNYKNPEEITRLHARRPKERFTVLRRGRLLGDLSKSRAFGDVEFKWSLEDLKYMFPSDPGRIPSNYFTPPYVSAEPEVYHYKLKEDYKFLILATDGLWELISSRQAVTLVDQHIRLFKGSSRNNAGSRDTDSNLFCDRNCATFLIRNALEILDKNVSSQLTIPAELVRQYRDDITVTIVYFDENY